MAATVLTRVNARARELLGEDVFDWTDRSYVIDWIVAAGLLLLSYIVSDSLPVFERDFSLEDPLISHKHTHQQISGTTNALIALAVPFTIAGVIGIVRASLWEIHHGFLAIFSGRAIARLITESLKNRVVSVQTSWQGVNGTRLFKHVLGTKLADVTDGRRSFPSGHSSTAFAGMTFISFFLAGKTAAWCFQAPISPTSITGTRLGRLMLTLLPLAFAAWVAISRVEDYRHHKEDVVVGSLIGLFSSSICYLTFWPNPFTTEEWRVRVD
ncbi:hypothetical protein EW146_g5423 [Bondarzewia mesenterica]|uniref:Phosphatidic acid phosphatase type 2/haloperoxidase domain-containing protein n=1 Tax=Bondarzewia mesenterica TaxID=1095465 RepID=A0A4S4LTM8_9AGAM|nr:hypothetical protein EW146_g5423 [Bondarzewia mesenterica]